MALDFGQEWSRDRAVAVDGNAAMHLNSVPTDPFTPGRPADFASKPAEKQAAAGVIESELEPDTKKASERADRTTGAAQKGFDGWETAAGLKKVADTWDQQVKALMGRLSSEKAALRGSSGLFVRNDTGLGSQFLTSKSKLDGL
ncbi:hypothetical protein OTB20_38075 [Streptomyces sp. H27-H1]|uniref:hypothetical protein n=1 Tax=Streptomyces sp. H27-H1 TaxID=2996461 RepID=UPI00226F0A4C|nr:hypothetical protein [Streptomyces sp. H27-H1]MCY0931884.1 hypothetical protein [Streptomyces sp. H27-H1]